MAIVPYEDRRKKGMDLGVVPPPLRPNCSFERALLFFQSSFPLPIFFLFSEGTTDQSERGQVTRYDFVASQPVEIRFVSESLP